MTGSGIASNTANRASVPSAQLTSSLSAPSRDGLSEFSEHCVCRANPLVLRLLEKRQSAEIRVGELHSRQLAERTPAHRPGHGSDHRVAEAHYIDPGNAVPHIRVRASQIREDDFHP